MASIREVAKLANVAPSTVSRALNASGYVSEGAKKKIKEAVENLDYIPNQWIRNLYQQKTGIIAVMTPDLIHPYFSSLWNCLECELHEYGYNMMLCNIVENKMIEREYLDTLERNLFDGMIVGTAFLPDEYYTKISKPIISLDRIISDIPLIASDHAQGGRIAAEKLLEKGCKRVLLTPQTKMDVASKRAGATFADILRENHVEVVYEDFDWYDVIHYQESIERAAMILRKYPDLDGVMINDLCAASFLKVAGDLNIAVPDKLKIIAYDGTFVTDFNYLTISSIYQDVSRIAKEAVTMLLKLINNQPVSEKMIYVPVHYKEGNTL